MSEHDRNQARQFIELAAKHRELLADVHVVVPVRPHDGMAVQLAQVCSVWYSEGITWEASIDAMGGFIEITRAKIALDFLRNHSERYLLMIDNDTEPPLALPWLLARHDKPVVGSPVASMATSGRLMLCFTRADRMGVTRFVDVDMGSRVPATGLADVPHTGTGAVMIRRDVLEAFTFDDGDVPFFIDEEARKRGFSTGNILQGEDMAFCKAVRRKGFSVHVDMEAVCGHRKTMRVACPPNARDVSLFPDDWHASTEGQPILGG